MNDPYDPQDWRYPPNLDEPLFAEPFDFDVIRSVLTDGWRDFGVHHWYRVWASRMVFESAIRQLGRLYRAWPYQDRTLLHRLFHWLLNHACEYNDEDARPLIEMLVSEIGIGYPPNPDPELQDVRLRERLNVPTGFGRRAISKALRFRVFKRDAFTCQYCGQRAPNVILHCDHIKPRSRGGADTFDNLITACIDCNLGKGALGDVEIRIAELKRSGTLNDNSDGSEDQ